jgi:hypothetical protein
MASSGVTPLAKYKLVFIGVSDPSALPPPARLRRSGSSPSAPRPVACFVFVPPGPRRAHRGPGIPRAGPPRERRRAVRASARETRLASSARRPPAPARVRRALSPPPPLRARSARSPPIFFPSLRAFYFIVRAGPVGG